MDTATEEAKGSVIDLKKETDRELNDLTVTVLENQEKAKEIVVKDDVTLGMAATMLNGIKKIYNNIEKKRKEYVQPLNETVKRINADFKEYKEPLEEAEKELKRKIKIYTDEQKRIAKEEQRHLLAKQEEERLAEEALQKEELAKAEENGDIIPRQDPVLPKPSVAVDMPKRNISTVGGGSVWIKKVWKATIIDETAVPRAYCVVSQTLINNAMRAGQRNITGVRIEHENQISGRS